MILYLLPMVKPSFWDKSGPKGARGTGDPEMRELEMAYWAFICRASPVGRLEFCENDFSVPVRKSASSMTPDPTLDC